MRRMYFIILSLALIGFNLTVSFNVSAKQSSKVPIGDILREVPLIDGHNDLPHKLRLMHRGAVGTFATGTSKFGLSTDVKRMKKGLVGAQFWSVYIPTNIQGAEAIQVTLEQIDLVHRMTEASPYLEMAYTADDVVRIHRTGRIASLIGIEGGHQIGNSLAALRMFHQLGARYMTLVHSTNNDWADSSTDERRHGGLTAFGRAIVGEMNRLGMVVDLSHVSDETMDAALKVTKAPPICSHSSVRAIANHPRNVPDILLKKIAAKKGVVMLAFVSDFINPEYAEWDKELMRVSKLWAKHGLKGAQKLEKRKSWEKENPLPSNNATIEQVADHIDHIKKLVGIDYIGLGSDFDGAEFFPDGLKDTSHYPKLLLELQRRGYSVEELQKIAGLNMLRVLRQSEQIAKKLQRARNASALLFKSGGGIQKRKTCPTKKVWRGTGYGLGVDSSCQ